MTVLLGTLVLNEMEWLPKLVEQHLDWPGLARWVFVEGADRAYAAGSPEMVAPDGLSVDGTTGFLERLAQAHPEKVTYIKHGFFGQADDDNGKIEARQRYLDVANETYPNVVITLDADEFYTKEHQGMVEPWVLRQGANGVVLKRREIWRPPSIADQPLMQLEVVEGFWAIPCCHWWRWRPGMRYGSSHNTPEFAGGLMNRGLCRYDNNRDAPQMVHMGFAATPRTRLAKNRYYAQRGEGVRDHRWWYVEARAAFETWRPGDHLPRGDPRTHQPEVIEYKGPIPECFSEDK